MHTPGRIGINYVFLNEQALLKDQVLGSGVWRECSRQDERYEEGPVWEVRAPATSLQPLSPFPTPVIDLKTFGFVAPLAYYFLTF